jgi:hypothetical protein
MAIFKAIIRFLSFAALATATAFGAPQFAAQTPLCTMTATASARHEPGDVGVELEPIVVKTSSSRTANQVPMSMSCFLAIF